MSCTLNRENFLAAKLAWQRGLLTDPNLTAFAKVLGSYLMHDLHSGRGGAWRSQSSLAELLSVDVRTIRRGASELVRAGHLRIAVSRGRGHANFYEAITPSTETRTYKSGATAESRTTLSVSPADNRMHTPGDDAANRLPQALGADTGALPSLSNPINNPLRPPVGARAARRENSITLAELTATNASPLEGRALGSTVSGRTLRRRFRNDYVRAAIAAHIGETAAASYLDPAAWRESDNTIVCRLSIAADTLRSRAGDLMSRVGITVVHDPAAHTTLTSNVIIFSEVA